MPNVRQMPQLYVRGSLANITMRNLTPSQRKHVDSIVARVSSHPEMQRHKIKVMKELGVTIAADYSDDREIASEEYLIAIWRGVVDLFYHRKYTFNCRACNSNTYMTKRSKPKSIDRIRSPCPNCRCVEIDSPGDVPQLQEMVKNGQRFLTHEEFQASYEQLPDGQKAPTSKSTIDYIPGERKYDDPQAIIDDDKQLRKFFGEFVWNYFRQQINENKRKEHKKDLEPLTGSTDYLLVQEILSLCNQMEIDYNYCEKMEPQNGWYSIRLSGLLTPPEFTAEFCQLQAKAELYGVTTRVTGNSIDVQVTPDAPPMPISADKDGRRWQIKVYRPEHVSVLDNMASTSDEQDNHTVSQISYRTVGGYRMDLENHVDTVDNSEVMGAIREALPDGHCRDVFDILSGQGARYMEFSNRYGDGDPKTNHIAEFLGITTRAVNTYKTNIKTISLFHNLVPSG